MIAYKLCRISDGKLYPLYVYSHIEMPIGQKLIATPGPKDANGKVISTLGKLAYRPGFHCCELPLADHIGKRMPNGKLYQRKNSVWCEVEINGNIDYTAKAAEGKKLPRDQYLKYAPSDGYYWYNTNPSAKIRWLIAGEMTIKRILTQDEVNKLCLKHGLKPQPVEK